MRTSAAPRRPFRRPLAATAVLALVLVGLGAGPAAAAPLVGGPTFSDPVTLPVPTLNGIFEGSNEESSNTRTSSTMTPPYWSNVGWYSFTPDVSGTLTVVTAAQTASYDTTLEVWTAAGGFVGQNDDYVGLNSRLVVGLRAGVPYRLGLGSWAGTGYAGNPGVATMTLAFTSAAPGAPTDVQAVADHRSAHVSWDEPDPFATSFTVWCTPEGGAEFGCGQTTAATGQSPATETTITDLTNGVTYGVRVTGHNSVGSSAPSATATVTPRGPATIEIAVDPAAPVSGELVNVAVTVTSADGPATGTVDVEIGGMSYPGVALVNGVAAVQVTLAVGSYTVAVAYSGSAAVTPGAASTTLDVAKRSQVVSFAPLPASPVYGDAPVTLFGSSSQSLPVTYSASGACTATGDQLSFTGVGECSVTASQAGTSEVHAASQTRTTMVAKRPQALAVSGLPPLIAGNGQFAVTSSSSVGLPVTLAASGACTVFGGVVTVTDVGTCTLTATQAGDAVTLPGTATVTATIAGTPATASLWIGFGVGDTAQGSPVVVTGSGLRPGMALTLTVYSTPTQVGATSASALGSAVTTGELPALEAGEHRVVARGTALDGTRVTKVVRFAVDDAGIVTRIGAPAPLADSGIQTAPAPLALLWLVLGLCLIATRRTLRRRTTT